MESQSSPLRWRGTQRWHTDPDGIYRALVELEQPCFIVETPSGIGAVAGGVADTGAGSRVLAAVAPLPPQQLGSRAFQRAHGVRYVYMTGAMANGIASAQLVIALARKGYLSSFGASGLPPDEISAALDRFEAEIPGLPFAVNLIHTPSEERLERQAVDVLLSRRVRCVEASAYLKLTPHLVRYRVAGLRRNANGQVVADNRVIAKVSRTEIAESFMRPAPSALVESLVTQGLISEEQAVLARHVPVADDVTAEADSGGHTDRRPLTVLLPGIVRQRDAIQREYRYPTPVRIGAAGGLGTPEALAGALAMGAGYLVTGSVNQPCVESGTSQAVKMLLSDVSITDYQMAPSADMFELGVDVQVLRKGTLFPMRAKHLYELYQHYDSLDALPEPERVRLETQILRRPLSDVWTDCVAYFERRDPDQIARAAEHPKRRMALVFRWYLGMSSRWAEQGIPGREADYQVWAGPAVGSFNAWVSGTYLKAPENRRVADVAAHLMRGAAFCTRLNQLRAAGVQVPSASVEYRPAPLENDGDVLVLGGHDDCR